MEIYSHQTKVLDGAQNPSVYTVYYYMVEYLP